MSRKTFGVIEYLFWLAMAYINVVGAILRLRHDADFMAAFCIVAAALCLHLAFNPTTDPDHPQE